ncbi:YbhB/YbcL family Raf kinase inhibitor-like protein [Arcicella lustrica]|uniref:YbhB/YbcL family Raf kinase inhibitor-like protein n=1 Tax=Arcicella lustrica TaxID=2984196 RepID=A0ABU5SQW1_9BACT|nr:YbhB/YbcL family Raf kinase inhibitor-like protein [Arcicella sp. DC25W]MEA5429294.1 YbhB/YbcL family Raf kinase inhibitor-like protein [Arcicella sp. DC25W]
MYKLKFRILHTAIIAGIILSITACSKDNNIDAIFILKSTEFTTTFMTNAQYANGFGGCTGENKSPQLSWENAPNGTKSFAVTIFDKDANSGAGFNHWLLVDIPTNTTTLLQDAGNFSGANIPQGALQTQTDAQVAGYVGVCPPVGETHNYEITVYALSSNTLGLSSASTPSIVKATIGSKTLASAKITVKATH